MKNNEIQKYTDTSISKMEQNLANLSSLLPSVREEKELWEWWNNLSEIWQDIFLINLYFENNESLEDNLVSLSDTVEGIYNTYYTRTSMDYEKSSFNINIDILKDIQSLEVLDCAMCDLNDIEPVRKLTKLRYFDCSSNNISDLEPIQGNLNIIKLDINGNYDLQNEKFVINSLYNLEILWLSNTNISMVEKTFSNLSNLRSLILEGNAVNENFDFRIFPKLEHIFSYSLLNSENFVNKVYPNLKVFTSRFISNYKTVQKFSELNPKCEIRKIYEDMFFSDIQYF